MTLHQFLLKSGRLSEKNHESRPQPQKRLQILRPLTGGCCCGHIIAILSALLHQGGGGVDRGLRLVDVDEDLLVVDVVVQGYHGNLAFTKLSVEKSH